MSHRVDVANDIAACVAAADLMRELCPRTAMPAEALLAIARNGGFVALGHAAGDDRASGFVCGVLGIYDYHFRHHSLALAVRAPRRGSGLALALRQAQRDHCLDQGVELAAWWEDPLESRAIRFAFAKLGVYARDFGRDLFGPEVDRLYLEWPIGAERTYRRLQGVDAAPSLEQAEREEIRYLLASRDGRPARGNAPQEESHLLLEIPASAEPLDDALAREWRMAVREGFEAAFAAGYAAVECLRAADGRLAYLLVPQPRRGEGPLGQAQARGTKSDV